MLPEAKIPRIGFGTWQIGGRFERNEKERESGVEMIREAYEVGYRLFDTAEIYANGLTEEIVGEALSIYHRNDYYLVSKVWKDHLNYAGIRSALVNSLKRLKTDYLDLYFVHWPNDEMDLCETMSSMESLVKDGLVNNIGVSNFSFDLIKNAINCLQNTKINFVQLEFNLYNREIEKDILPFCIKNNIKVIAYRPFAKGDLVSNPPAELFSISKKYKKTPAQIALRWIIEKGAIPIPKSSNKERMKENMDVLLWSLSKEDVDYLDKISKK